MKLKITSLTLAVVFVLSLTACSSENNKEQTGAETADAADTVGIVNVTAITEVFGTGQMITGAVVEYGAPVDASKLTATDFSVADGTITKIYTNNAAAKSESGAVGNFVILELAVTETGASSDSGNFRQSGFTPGEGEENSLQHNSEESPDMSGEPPAGNGASPNGAGSQGGPTLGSAGDEGEPSNHLTVTITQTGDIYTTEGQTIPAMSEPVTSTRNNNLIVDDFQQLVFTDPDYDNQEFMYNLYVPEDYDANKTYPLVLFISDAGGVSTDPVKTLTQGLGAVIWASSEEQAKHACFVLAPQYTRVMADDSSQTTEDMDITIDLIRDLITRYSIDTDRIYNTGQSMGCMTSIAMDIKYPDLFAASFLVAGQWDTNLVAPLADKPLWIVVCEGDTKANPGMDAITEKLKTYGATVSKAVWDSTVDAAGFDAYVKAMLADNAQINYTVFEGGSHTYTWQVAYTIEGIRDWLFAQSK